jgi:CheY-like chemotaxis protein
MIDLKQMSVLIVDDMENMCKSIRGMLKVLNYGSSFRFAFNGAEAWNILQKQPMDFAIVDWNMPSMTGVELLGRMREEKILRDMPVVMVTAEANREIVAEAAESDIDAYILKPLTVKSLGDKIADVVEKANNPPPLASYLKRARDLEESGEPEAAFKEIQNAIDAEPLSTRPLREMGKLHLKMNNLEQAEKWLAKAAKLNKLDVIAFHHLGELYLKKNDIEKAAEYFEKAMNISPRHVTRGVQFGKVLVQRGAVKKGLAVFEKALALSGNSPSVQEEVADFCLEKGINEYALKILESILQQSPSRKDISYRIGVANENLGQYRKALDYFIDAGKMDRNNIDIQVRIAKNYIASGQVLRAEQMLSTILRKDPENESAKEMMKQCL